MREQSHVSHLESVNSARMLKCRLAVISNSLVFFWMLDQPAITCLFLNERASVEEQGFVGCSKYCLAEIC